MVFIILALLHPLMKVVHLSLVWPGSGLTRRCPCALSIPCSRWSSCASWEQFATRRRTFGILRPQKRLTLRITMVILIFSFLLKPLTPCRFSTLFSFLTYYDYHFSFHYPLQFRFSLSTTHLSKFFSKPFLTQPHKITYFFFLPVLQLKNFSFLIPFQFLLTFFLTYFHPFFLTYLHPFFQQFPSHVSEFPILGHVFLSSSYCLPFFSHPFLF